MQTFLRQALKMPVSVMAIATALLCAHGVDFAEPPQEEARELF
jgi:hypothetical protein